MRHWFVMHRKGKRLSAAAEAFEKFVLTEAHDLLQPVTTPAPGTTAGKPRTRARRRV